VGKCPARPAEYIHNVAPFPGVVMGAEPKKRNVLLYLAAEGVVPVLGGCAGAVAAGPAGGVAGVAVGRAVEKAVNLFGKEIVERWAAWLADRKPAEAAAAVSELVTLTPAEAREEVRTILLRLAPEAEPKDLDVAVEYLSALPRAVDRALVPNPDGEGRTVPPTLSLADPRQLLQLLPEDVPPYPTGADLPGTPYRLVELIGTGGFGAVYRAFSPTLQHLPLAIKFCLDRGLVPALHQERSNLERLMRAGGPGAAHVVRLYGYDLDHPTPFLVYEYVAGGDLTAHLAARRAALGRPPGPDEVLGWVLQIAEGLAFAHRAGLVHRDLKPANVLVGGTTLKLADFGIGGVAVRRAVQQSRIGATTLEYLSLAEQASLFRGAGTPLYMSPEQRRGADPDPRHDLYALGVVWFQLLVGDVSRELPHGWAKELRVRFGVPAGHVELIERCVGWIDDRPKDADELLPLLREASGHPAEPVAAPAEDLGRLTPPARQAETVTAASAVTPTPPTLSGPRRTLLVSLVNRLHAAYAEDEKLGRRKGWPTVARGLAVGLPVGWLAGEVAYVVRNDPVTFPNAFRPVPNDWTADGLGIAVGLGVWFLYWLIAGLIHGATRVSVQNRGGKLADELAAEFPAEVATWGGKAVLREPATVREIRDAIDPPPAPPPSATSALTPEQVAADPTRKAVLVGRLRELDRVRHKTIENTDGTWVGLIALWIVGVPIAGSGVVGIGTGAIHLDPLLVTALAVATVLSVGWGSWWAMAAIRRHLRQKWDGAVNQFVADYPHLVAAWGGRVTLQSGETIAALLKTYDPEAAARRPGVFRQLFGR
jgi:serine/threonine protein kinase